MKNDKAKVEFVQCSVEGCKSRISHSKLVGNHDAGTWKLAKGTGWIVCSDGCELLKLVEIREAIAAI